jgi:hypothetical protein
VGAEGSLSSCFIAKLNPAGTALAYSTYLGGNQTDSSNAIAVDGAGEAYVGGNTDSFIFPVTPGVFQGVMGMSTLVGFVTRLNASGSALVYSTYLGGKNSASVNSIALDSNGNAYVAGSTNSPDFPVTAGAFQTTLGTTSFGYPQTNAFVTELNSTATALVYSTFLGGSVSLGADADEGDVAGPIAVDGQGMVYLSGAACTRNFPVTAGALETRNLAGEIGGECTAFLTKVNPVPDTPLVYSTFLGGTGNTDPGDYPLAEAASGLALDSSGNVYLAGLTYSVDFPVTPGVIETPFTSPSFKAFVTEFNGSEMKPLPIPTLTLTSSPSSVLFGQPVTFTATLQPASGNSTPSGYVAFNFVEREPSDDEGIQVGFGPWTTVALNGSGVATFTTSSLQALQTPVNAFYLGDANNAAATGTMTQTFTDLQTVTTVTSSANNVPYGTPVVFTATVLDNTGKPAKGFVIFIVGSADEFSPNLNSAGQTTWTNGTGGGPLPVGTTTVEAEYFPATGYQTSIGTLAETFTPLGTTPTPAFTPPPGTYTSAEQVTLVDSNSAANFYYTTDGSTPVPGTSPQFFPIQVNASETINALAVAPGYSPSNVVSAAYTINLPPPDFTIVLGTQVMVVAPGGSGSAEVDISGLHGFAQSVSLSCSGLPAGVTCAFAPSSVTGTGTATLMISASSYASMKSRPVDSPLAPFVALAATFGCICMRRRRIGLPMLFACTLSLLALSGCGGGSSSGSGSSSTVSTVTVTGTSGSLSHAVSLSLALTQ